MAINPITFANRVNRQFLRYQMTAFPLSDKQISEQAKTQISGENGSSPLIKGPYISLSRAYKLGPAKQDLIDQGLLHPAIAGVNKYNNIFKHQYEALLAVQDSKHVIVATGTGSGKTEAFLYPILNDCLRMRDTNEPEGVVAVIVYPMNALASDQLDRLREMLAGTGISFGMYIGSTPHDDSALYNQVRPSGDSKQAYEEKRGAIRKGRSIEVVCPFEERITEKEIAENPPRILLTNFNQLEMLLTRGRDLGMFKDAPLKYLVFDEAHTYSGVKGAEVSILIRRLRAFANKSADEVTCIGSSATISDPDDPEAAQSFASRFFGVDKDKVKLIEESYEDEKWSSVQFSQPLKHNLDENHLDLLLTALENDNPKEIGTVASKLTSHDFNLTGDWQIELNDHFRTSKYVRLLFEHLKEAIHLDEAVEVMQDALGREDYNEECAKIELLAMLALCGAAIKDDDALLKPKLHFFVHGLQGATGVLGDSDDNQTNVQFFMSHELAVAEHEDRLPSAFYSVSTCRVCGQHAMETWLSGFSSDGTTAEGGDAEGDNVIWLPTPDQSGSRTLFTNRFTVLDDDPDAKVEARIDRRTHLLYTCRYCGTFHLHSGNSCSNDKCARTSLLLPVYAILPQKEGGVNVTCPSCNTKPFRISGREVEPFRKFKAVAVADVHILSQDMLNAYPLDDERLIVFSDNRQDAAFQAGWMQDHARLFRFRHLIYHFLQDQTEPVSINEIEAYLIGLYHTDRELIQALCPEVFSTHTPTYFGTSTEDTLSKYIRLLLLQEFNRPFKHSRSLETWGLLKVVYADLTPNNESINDWAAEYDIPIEDLVLGIEKLLDLWRRNGRMLFDEREPIFSHYWKSGDKEVANGFLPLMDYPPKGIKLTRGANDKPAYVSQIISHGGITLAMGFVRKWGLDITKTNDFLEKLWDWLVSQGLVIQTQLHSNVGNPLPGCASVYQVNSAMLGYQIQEELYQCGTCHRYHNSKTPEMACTTHHCAGHIALVEISEDDYNISTLVNPFKMVMAQEHSAQVPPQSRENIEREFKKQKGRVNTLVATPTLEMGVDIGDLDMILLRNVPPLTANYWQRVGRAGRRHRMAVLYTYCRNSHHDNYFFEDPYRLLRSPVDPPRFNLKNRVMIKKHVHAAILSYLIRTTSEMPGDFPTFVAGYLFEEDGRYRSVPKEVSEYGDLVKQHEQELLAFLQYTFSQYWPEDAIEEITGEILAAIISSSSDELQLVVNRLFQRLQWARKTRETINQQEKMKPLSNSDERLRKRCGDFIASLQERSAGSYTLTVLATNGYLPGYGTYSGSVSGRAERFKTSTGQSIFDFELNRPESMAIREFVPGNLIYANSGRFQIGLYHLPVDHTQTKGDRYVIHPETEVIEIASQSTGYGDTTNVDLAAIAISDVDLTYVSRISDEENLRFALPVKIMGLRQSTHRGGTSYKLGQSNDLHYISGQDVRLINVGPSDRVAKGEFGFWVCGVCGGVRSPYAVDRVVEQFIEYHRDKCGRQPEPIGFSADVTVDGLLFKNLEGLESAVNLGAILKRAAANTIEMDIEDLQYLFFPQNESQVDLFLYDPMPGGSGLLQQIIDLWDDVLDEGLKISGDCPLQCETACYECLKSYRNVFYHEILNRHKAASILEDLKGISFSHDIPEKLLETSEQGQNTLPSEERLEKMLLDEGFSVPKKQEEIPLTIDGFPNLSRTVPDFVYPDQKVAIYLDGMSGHLHGNKQTELIDRLITDELEELEWKVIRIQYPELSDPTVMGIYYRKLSRALK
jgi:ATP-dependent helicase YprA (DUF1998 family)